MCQRNLHHLSSKVKYDLEAKGKRIDERSSPKTKDSKAKPPKENPEVHRLGLHPRKYFAAPQHQYDLDAVAAKLKQELEASQADHLQQTLYTRGPTTVALYLSGHLTRLSPHLAQSAVIMHLLEGHVQIKVENNRMTITPANC